MTNIPAGGYNRKEEHKRGRKQKENHLCFGGEIISPDKHLLLPPSPLLQQKQTPPPLPSSRATLKFLSSVSLLPQHTHGEERRRKKRASSCCYRFGCRYFDTSISTSPLGRPFQSYFLMSRRRFSQLFFFARSQLKRMWHRGAPGAAGDEYAPGKEKIEP